MEVFHKDGSIRCREVTMTLIRDGLARPMGILGISHDITDRKIAEETQYRLTRELRAINNCHQILVRAKDEQTLLNDICHVICDDGGYRMAWVGYAENDDDKTIRRAAWAGVEDGYLEQANLTWADTPRGRGPSGTTIRTGESTCIQDFATDPCAAPWRDSALQRGYRSSIALPLNDQDGNTFGFLSIYSAEPNTFTAEEIRLLEGLSTDLAFGITVLRSRIERQRVETALQEAERETSLKNRILEAFLAVSDDKVFAELLKIGLDLTDSELGMFGYFDARGAFVVPTMTRGIYRGQCLWQDKEIVFGRVAFGGIWGKVIDEKRTLYSNEGPFDTPQGHIPIKNTMVTPVIYGGEVIGTIHLANKSKVMTNPTFGRWRPPQGA